MNVIDGLLRTYFYENREAFGEDAVFEGFRQTGGASVDERRAFCAVFGTVVYSRDGCGHCSPLMLAKYFDSKAHAGAADGGFDSLSWFAVETSFYRTVLPAFNSLRSARHLVPELWAAGAVAVGSAQLVALVFQRLDGFAEFGCASYLDYGHLSLMARRIGELHAYSMAARRANPRYLARAHCSPTTFEQYHRVLPLLQRCAQSLRLDAEYQRPADDAYAKGVRRLKRMVEEFAQWLHRPLTVDGRHDCWVLCHQNYTQANVLYRYEAQQPVDMRVCNWQWMGFASLGVDLAVPLLVEANDETRARFLEQLLADYRQALGTFGDVPVPSVERILEEVKASVPVALYVLASRVLAQSQVADSKSWTPLWTEERMTESLKNLVSTGFI